MTDIYHAHLYGNRNSKYDWLLNHDVVSTNWQAVTPQAPFYLLIPQNTDLLGEYNQGWKITDVMKIFSSGIKTHRDHFCFDFDLMSLKNRIKDFKNLDIRDEDIKNKYNLKETRDWKISESRQALASNDQWRNYYTRSIYRPFDFRFYYHHKDVVELPRNEVMQHIFNKQNLCLLTSQRVEVPRFYDQIFCSNLVAQNHALCIKEANYIFPLWIYPDSEQLQELQQKKRANFSEAFLKLLKSKLDYLPKAEAIFYYIYAVFHSHTYRTRYAEFLKIDFPRVPLTSDDRLFRQLADYGEQLVGLHLMTSPTLDNLITEFTEQGDKTVAPGHPKYANGKVTINKQGDGFVGVPEEVWNFYVGGYQVCQKWLKDRKERVLSDEDILHYQKIVVALQETIKLMQSIDKAIPSWPIE